MLLSFLGLHGWHLFVVRVGQRSLSHAIGVAIDGFIRCPCCLNGTWDVHVDADFLFALLERVSQDALILPQILTIMVQELVTLASRIDRALLVLHGDVRRDMRL